MPVTTRRAHHLSLPILTNLPTELIIEICQLLPPPALVDLGGCSRMLRTLSRTPSLWTVLDFGDFPKSAANLTDLVLMRLLDRIGAAHSLTSISLVGCSRISGWGLLSLGTSTCLTSIDLRRAAIGCDDDDGRYYYGGRALSHSLVPRLIEPKLKSGQLTHLMVNRLDMQSPGSPLTPIRPDHFFGSFTEMRQRCAMCISVLPPPAIGPHPKLTHCGTCYSQLCEVCLPRATRPCDDCGRRTCVICVRTTPQGGWMCLECLEDEHN